VQRAQETVQDPGKQADPAQEPVQPVQDPVHAEDPPTYAAASRDGPVRTVTVTHKKCGGSFEFTTTSAKEQSIRCKICRNGNVYVKAARS
jgi:hypothetical protein